jgi:hypothetical protein
MKKGRGWLIHVLDFVEEENGQLIIWDQNGMVVKDACCITYSGAHRDPWWDHNQLLAQVDKAILIFEEAHLNCVALFVFDHSLAHASLTLEHSMHLIWIRAMGENREDKGIL